MYLLWLVILCSAIGFSTCGEFKVPQMGKKKKKGFLNFLALVGLEPEGKFLSPNLSWEGVLV
jgi:hypothetical protein